MLPPTPHSARAEELLKTPSMLESLSIQNFALIDQLRVKIEPGLTVITGETGAGKSTLLQAITLLAGARALASMVRTGTDSAKVEATFSLQDAHLSERLRALGVKDSKRLTITRTIHRGGRKNEALVNGVAVSVVALQELMGELIEISGQHDAHSLRQASMHLSLIDQAAGLGDPRRALESTYHQLARVEGDIAEAHRLQRGQAEREDFLRYQLNELKEARLLDPHEDERLKHEAIRLRNGERLRQQAYSVEAHLYSQPSSAVERLQSAAQALRRLVDVDDSLRPLLDDLETARAIAEEVARSAAQYVRALSGDTEGLEELDDRLDLLNTLKAKHRCTLGQVIERQREIERELSGFESLEGRLKTLEAQRASLARSLAEQSASLGEARRAFAPTLCRSIERELSDLGMPEARLSVEFSANPVGQGCEVEGVVIGPRGGERALLMISANPGEPLMPVHTAASGGELSRVTLAIKRVIADLDPVSVYIFDEMDSGVGGPTAEAVGLKLSHISRSRQVLCITHSPQVAGIGDQHLFVCKQVRGERTRSVVRALTVEQRVEEVSRMLGGARITDRTRANARELLRISG